jgi:DNA-binding GntR family transcriptional regulator
VHRPVPVPRLALDAAPGATLRDRVLAALREAIVSGRLAPAARISEPSLARELKVSRGPIREAIRELAAEGLVRIEPRVGTFVTHPDAREVRELFAIQAVLEGLAARGAAEAGTEADRRARLQPHVEGLSRLGVLVDPLDYLYPARRFHEALLEMSGNTRLVALHKTQTDQLFRLLRPLVKPTFLTRHDREHRAIVAAVVAGDGASAERLARAHTSRVGERLLAEIEPRRPLRRAG